MDGCKTNKQKTLLRIIPAEQQQLILIQGVKTMELSLESVKVSLWQIKM